MSEKGVFEAVAVASSQKIPIARGSGAYYKQKLSIMTKKNNFQLMRKLEKCNDCRA